MLTQKNRWRRLKSLHNFLVITGVYQEISLQWVEKSHLELHSLRVAFSSPSTFYLLLEVLSWKNLENTDIDQK